MKNTFKFLTLALLSLIFLPNLLFGQLYEVSFDEKIQKSTLVVEGQVVESKCYRADDETIYTAHKIKITALLKGEYRDKYLTITTWGGEIDGELQTWTHLLTLNKGERGVFFLEPTRVPAIKDTDYPESFDVYAASQGFVQFVQNDARAWVGQEPFHTYNDISNDLFAYIERQTGQTATFYKDGKGDEKRSGIRYRFTDIGFQGNSVTFSTYVNSLIGNKKLYKSGIQLGYNPAFFGSNIATNGNLLMQDGGISLSNTYDLAQSNVTSSKVKIELVPVGSLNGLTEITTSEQLLAKGKITIQNLLADPGITYDIAEMQAMSKFYEGGLQQVFDTVIVEGDWRLFEQFAPQIDSIRPLSLRAGTNDILTIYGSNFGSTQGSSYVEFTNAYEGITNGVDWIQPLTSDYNMWSDSKIEVFVPSVAKNGNYEEYAGSGKVRVRVSGSTKTSIESIKVRLAVDNRALADNGQTELKRKKVRLIGDFGEDSGYTLYYNSNFKNLSGAIPAFERALCTWVQSSNINFRVKELSAIDQIYQQYACQVSLTNSLPQGTNSSLKAVTEKNYFLGCQDALGNQTTISLKKFDIYFRQSANWFVNQQYDPTLPFSYWEANQDLETFALHELGHAQLLSHVNQTSDVMYYEVLTPKRGLEDGDTEGGEYIKSISIVNEPNCSISPIIANSDCGLIPTIETWRGNLVKIQPNPATNQIIVEGQDEIEDIKTFNTIGMPLVEAFPNESSITLNISDLPAGIYIVTIRSRGQLNTIKFEKI